MIPFLRPEVATSGFTIIKNVSRTFSAIHGVLAFIYMKEFNREGADKNESITKLVWK